MAQAIIFAIYLTNLNVKTMYEINMNQIIITPAANGWLVRMPQASFLPPIDSDEAIRHQARIMKEEMMGDDILGKLKSPVNNLGDTSMPQSFPLVKDERLHIFKTFAEVLGFLKFTITENEN